MKIYDAVIVGGGPAGLGAAIEIAKAGGHPVLVDENGRPGGQLFKQIHKFFGSKEHCAGERGFQIGEKLLKEVQNLQVDVMLNTRVWGITPGSYVSATRNGKSLRIYGKTFIFAVGAGENALTFPGCTLPGVMTAGAAQTMANVHGVLPGDRIVMVGTGNVGLIVSYQLLQAGAEIAAVLDVTSDISGYSVHAGKLKRAGVPFFLGYHVKEAIGTSKVEKVILEKVDEKYSPIPGTEMSVQADTLCLAVGLTPRIELAEIAHCEKCWSAPLGGCVPLHSAYMETSDENIFIAGDLSGIEEASTALEEGRQAGLTAAKKAGVLSESEWLHESEKVQKRLAMLRSGTFGEKRQKAKEEIWEKWNRR